MKKRDKNMYVSQETMEARKLKIEKLIDKGLSDIEKEIELLRNGKEGDTTIEVLEKIKIELEKMKEVLSPQQFVPTYNYIIRDSWNTFSHLGEELLHIVNEYNEKLI